MRASPSSAKQTRSWYRQPCKKQIDRGRRSRQGYLRRTTKLALQGWHGAADTVTTILEASARIVCSNRAPETYRKIRNHLRPFAKSLGPLKAAKLRPHHSRLGWTKPMALKVLRRDGSVIAQVPLRAASSR